MSAKKKAGDTIPPLPYHQAIKWAADMVALRIACQLPRISYFYSGGRPHHDVQNRIHGKTAA